ncbi:hypothetical protein NQ318_008460 [Aromia moschata]|uniref:RNase H type-1 domain-containing protein n=1 Tax=Aromia moschata TaxID=1265417 RepID=A0AAV8Y9A3_9CUCU|nr:hypothetical protein NQ318_008460 [Aromia moschata]
MRSAYRLTGLGHWIGEEQTTGHATIWNKATEHCPVLLMLQDSVEPTICPSPKLGIQIPSRDDWDNTNNTICQNGIIWFTDGSKIGDKAGAGVYGKTTRTKLSFALGSYASVFQAEIYAILACGMEILKTAPKRRTIQICTDSQAALMAIESSKVKSRLVLDCKKILNDLASCNRVILTWVPGHSGVPGNEEADRLARLGSIGYPIGPEPILGVPYSMGVSTMKELLNKEFEKSWQEAPVLKIPVFRDSFFIIFTFTINLTFFLLFFVIIVACNFCIFKFSSLHLFNQFGFISSSYNFGLQCSINDQIT